MHTYTAIYTGQVEADTRRSWHLYINPKLVILQKWLNTCSNIWKDHYLPHNRTKCLLR